MEVNCMVILFGRRKKLIQDWNNLRMSKWRQNFHFCVTYPFKKKLNTLKLYWEREKYRSTLKMYLGEKGFPHR